jgi:hypothetical protein
MTPYHTRERAIRGASAPSRFLSVICPPPALKIATSCLTLTWTCDFQARRRCSVAMGRWAVTTTPMGALQLQTNTRTGKSKGVSKSGDKRTARVWCPRRQKQMHVGTFNSTPEAAAAIASAELLGPENLPTPAARKPRTKKSGAHFAAWRSPCRLMTESVCVWSTSRARHRVPAEDGAARPRAV